MTKLILGVCADAPISDQIRHPIYYDNKRRIIVFSETTKFVIILPVADFKTGDGYFRFQSESAAMNRSQKLLSQGQPHQIIDKDGMNYCRGYSLNGTARLKRIEEKELVFDYEECQAG